MGEPLGRLAREDQVGSGEEADAECPYCGSTETVREHPKGPGLCRSMHYCRECEEPFEQFA